MQTVAIIVISILKGNIFWNSFTLRTALIPKPQLELVQTALFRPSHSGLPITRTSARVGSNSSFPCPVIPDFSGIISINWLCCLSAMHRIVDISSLVSNLSLIPRIQNRRLKLLFLTCLAHQRFVIPSKKQSTNNSICSSRFNKICN